MDKEGIGRFLLAFEKQNPFNNFTSLLRSKGKDVPAAIGGACDVLAARFSHQAGKLFSCDFGSYKGETNPHVVVLAGNAADGLLLEPSYFANKPVSLADLWNVGSQSAVLLPAMKGKEY